MTPITLGVKLAVSEDLPEIKKTFDKIIDHLNNSGIHIWDENYPYLAFVKDVENRRLYVLKDGVRVVSAFAFLNNCPAAEHFEWENADAKAVYLFRLGVNVNNMREGIAAKMIEAAKQIAKEQRLKYIRLFVADDNIPAMRFYENTGFTKVKGSYTEVLNDRLIHEIGFETRV